MDSKPCLLCRSRTVSREKERCDTSRHEGGRGLSDGSNKVWRRVTRIIERESLEASDEKWR